MEYFVAVVEHGSVTRAAESLFIAQPSLSQAIRSLETQLGADLFERRGRGLHLTDAGRRFEGHARRVLADVAEARRRVEAVRAVEGGRLRLAATHDLHLSPLPRLAAEFRALHPGVELHVDDFGGPGGVVGAVRGGSVDLGFTTLPARTDGLAVVNLRRQNLVLVLDEATASGLPDPVPQALLSEIALLREQDDHLADLVDDPAVLAPRPGSLVTAHRRMLWELVMAGAGAAFMPEGFAARHLRGIVERHTTPPISREVAVVHRPGPLGPAAAVFIDLATQATSA